MGRPHSGHSARDSGFGPCKVSTAEGADEDVAAFKYGILDRRRDALALLLGHSRIRASSPDTAFVRSRARELRKDQFVVGDTADQGPAYADQWPLSRTSHTPFLPSRPSGGPLQGTSWAPPPLTKSGLLPEATFWPSGYLAPVRLPAAGSVVVTQPAVVRFRDSALHECQRPLGRPPGSYRVGGVCNDAGVSL